jgi:DNA-binding transcriptional regulator YiaG
MKIIYTGKGNDMANAKIEKVSAEISKVKEKLEDSKMKTAEYTAKIKDLEQLKTTLENDEIIALFRREKLSEDEFAALLRSQKKDSLPAETDLQTGAYDNPSAAAQENEEDRDNEADEN